MRSHDRFSRQTCVPSVDQSKIDNASVLVVGAGGLGSPVILYLSAAGVGTINVYDPDYVDETNLHRQVLYTDRDVGNPKAVATAMRLKDLGTDGWVSQHFFPSHPPPEYKGFLNDYAVILDCTDRWSSHDAVVQSGLASGKSVVHGSIQGLLGRVMVFRPGGACWRCLHPSEPSGVKDGPRGTLGPVCGVIGSMMAMEALKIILGWPPQEDRMSVYDARSGEVLSLPRAPSEECPCRAQ